VSAMISALVEILEVFAQEAFFEKTVLVLEAILVLVLILDHVSLLVLEATPVMMMAILFVVAIPVFWVSPVLGATPALVANLLLGMGEVAVFGRAALLVFEAMRQMLANQTFWKNWLREEI